MLISLPDVSPCLRWTFGGKKVEPRSRVIFDLPSLWTKPHLFDGQHYWELGKRGFPLSKIRAEMSRAGLVLDASFRVFDMPYHRFLSAHIKGSEGS